MENFTSDLENLKVMKPLFQDKWFHTYKEDGDITYQGHVLDYAPPQFVLVQLFSWIDGHPTHQKLFNLADHDFHFYDSQEDMCNAWDLHLETFHHVKVESKSYLETIRKLEQESPNGNIKDEDFKRQIDLWEPI